MAQKERVVLITGAAKRIGAAIVRKLAQDGWSIALHCHRSHEQAETLLNELSNQRGNIKIFTADLSNPKEVEKLREEVVNWKNRIDALVNNASVYHRTKIEEIVQDQWINMLQINLITPIELSKQLAEKLKESNGAIVNISDIHAYSPLPEFCAYSASKAGLIAASKTLAQEFAPYVRVNVIAPGSMTWPESPVYSKEEIAATEKNIPLQRLGTGEDVALAVHFLLNHPYITGQILAVDGGRSVVGFK